MRRAITALLERYSHGVRRRVPGLVRFAYQPGRERIPIDWLISPLRYDILVRQQYFEVLRERRALAEEDFDAFLELSRQHPYFTYFTQVAIPSHQPGMMGNDKLVAAAFERRVRASVALHDSFDSTGYDKRRPIILRTGAQIEPTATGKRLARTMHAGDGCHRLAWLRASGVDVLEPDMYRMHVAQVLTPRDDTALLLAAMTVGRPEYFSFLSLSYADEELYSEEALLDHVRSTRPGLMPELEQVIAVDSPLLAGSVTRAEGS
jgi:hypothetical protein